MRCEEKSSMWSISLSLKKLVDNESVEHWSRNFSHTQILLDSILQSGKRINEQSNSIKILVLTGVMMFRLWNWWNNMPHLTFPDITHKSRHLDMIAEWKDFPDPRRNPGRLFMWENYEEFLEIVNNDLTNNQKWINGSLFFFMDDDEILGAIQIRHHIDHPRLSLEWECGGHIGYGLRPSARGKWLAREMLSFWLIEARKLGIEKVLISADEDNPASWKTIESCGWIYLKSIIKEGRQLKVYWI